METDWSWPKIADTEGSKSPLTHAAQESYFSGKKKKKEKKPASSNQYAVSLAPFEVELLDQKRFDSIQNNFLKPF